EDLYVCDLRLYLRRGSGSPEGRYCSGDQVGRCAPELEVSGVRCRKGRLRDDGNL
ncbi:MAG: Rubredoxin, partial [Olavius algarvensis Gamma 1 endosymbiont]